MYLPHIECQNLETHLYTGRTVEYACAQADLIMYGLPVPKTNFLVMLCN